PKSEAYEVYARPDTGKHFEVGVRFADAPGLGPLAADIQVPGGAVLLRGRVTDKATGKPVPGAQVRYYPFYPSSAVGRLAGYPHCKSGATAGPDGSFCVAGLPGSGVLGAVAPAKEAYRPAQVTVEELVDFSRKYKEPPPILSNAPTLA